MACSGVARRLTAALAAAALLAGLASCGDDDASPSGPPAVALQDVRLAEREEATLVLDFVPNAVHAGIYRAVAAGYYEDVNVDLRIIQPTSTADTLKLIDAGKADVGLADGIDVAGQIDAGTGAQAIQAIVQRPLGGLVAEEGIADPRELEGREVGVTGVPSDGAVLDTIVAGAGGDPAEVDVVTVGFNGPQALAAGRLAAFTGYWPADAVQLEETGTPVEVFALDDFGGPAYPGLVAFSTLDRIEGDAPLLRAIMAATAQGYDDAIEDPDAALDDLLDENPELQRDVTEAQLRAYRPLFRADAPAFGVLDPTRLHELSSFLVARDLIDEPIEPERFAADLQG